MTDNATTAIRFVLDGELVELSNFDPTRTVLQFLREDIHRTGTKEGCAEGDCGACTVVVAEAGKDGRLQARAINACIQFLPTLDGKELLTVESLKGNDGALHPVQQAMVDCHGSQCGFCTPGFIMSMFALYKNQESPDRVAIDDALAGNLCRCTGYRPIVDAARSMYDQPAPDTGSWLTAPHGPVSVDERQRVERLQSLQHEKVIELAHQDRKFFAPCTVAQLADLLRDNPSATLLAGGTDVGLWVTKQHRELQTVIYTGRVNELQAMSVSSSQLVVGAAVTFTDLMPILAEHFPTLNQLMLRFASPPIRNAGTLGGNVANGSPIGDSMPALLALDCSVRLVSTEGSRELPLSDFYFDYQETALRKGEFVEAIMIPRLAENDVLRSYKISKRFDQDISAVCGAYRLRIADGTITDARVSYGGLAAIPKRAAACEKVLQGASFSETAFTDAAAALDADFEPISDMRASDEYRRRVAKNLLLRLFHDIDNARGSESVASIYDFGRQQSG